MNFARKRRWLPIAAVVLAALSIGVAVISSKWPFSRAAVIRSLQEASSGAVTVGAFRSVFFPNPGCVEFGPRNNRDAFATRVKGSYRFYHADLEFAGGIAGILESEGIRSTPAAGGSDHAKYSIP